jgi:hypothetical protein
VPSQKSRRKTRLVGLVSWRTKGKSSIVKASLSRS